VPTKLFAVPEIPKFLERLPAAVFSIRTMYAIPITIEEGVLKLPPNSKLPAEARNAILIVGDELHTNDDLDSTNFNLAALRDNPALDFLKDEPDLYSTNDILPNDRNPHFVSR
jgi:hypothetical protein